jgi:Jacalin-like lectin domain
MLSFPGYMEEGSITIGTPITYGPWGGSGGTIFDDGMYTGIRQINLTRAAGICSIKVLYDRNGQAVWGNKHGYNGTVGITDKVCRCCKNTILLLFKIYNYV